MSKNVKKKVIVADSEAVKEAEKEFVAAEPAPIRPLYEQKPAVLTPEEEYQRLYSWISKGDIDATLKCILKELVMIRMGGGHV
jgi:hypothetical protein